MADPTLGGAWSGEVLQFWFAELSEAQWFTKDAAVDAAITARFAGLHGAIAAETPAIAAQSPDGALAAVIVLDQFSRNMFRATPAAFAHDAQALAIAERAVDAGFDRTLPGKQRWFMYLPFEHSEDRSVQVRSQALFTAYGDAKALDYAMQHKVIIDRFGRYPHRNAILGRVSTAEEIAFLAGPGSSF
jgi:uncharacterized protein (DUF924 family)